MIMTMGDMCIYFKHRKLQKYSGVLNRPSVFENKEDIECFQRELKTFNISFFDLVMKSSSMDQRIKEQSLKVAKILSKNDVLFHKMKKDKRIPKEEIMTLVNTDEYILKQNQKFILALSLIYRSNLLILKGYLEKSEKPL